MLENRLRAAHAGEGQVVLVSGEPGVGKTRLAEETAGQARELGFAVATGRAVEDDGSPPYWPFRQVFKALGQPAPAQLSDPDPTVPSGGSPQERFRLFEAVTDELVGAAGPAGLFVLLDDIQWTDSASLRLLVHLSMAAARSRLIVLATYRDTETAGQEPLRAAVTALAREPAVTRLPLTGLSEAEVETHLSGVVGWAVPATVAAAVCRRTQGNPFFVGELGRVLLSSVDGQLPDGVRDAVRDRLARLSPSCRAVVSAAAVLGSDVDPAALASTRSSRRWTRRPRPASSASGGSGTTSSGRRRGSNCPRPSGSPCTGGWPTTCPGAATRTPGWPRSPSTAWSRCRPATRPRRSPGRNERPSGR